MFFLVLSLFPFVFQKPNGEWVKLACYIILLWSEGDISSPVGYSHLSLLPDDNAKIFATSLFVPYCIFSSLILLSVFMVSFFILSKRFFLKHNELSDARVHSITKKEHAFAVHFFTKLHLQVLKLNIWRMIKCGFLKFLIVWNVQNEIMRRISSNTSPYRKLR